MQNLVLLLLCVLLSDLLAQRFLNTARGVLSIDARVL